MRNAASIKADLLDVLQQDGDGRFGRWGFGRGAGSLSYERNFKDARQSIVFNVDTFPRYEPGAELHIHPSMHLAMTAVTDAALKLVGGDAALLANAPDIIVNQPIEVAAPKDAHVRWFATGKDQMRERVRDIAGFTECRLIPFLNGLGTPDDLVTIYSNNDGRMMKLQHWYVYVAAAYILLGKPNEAREVLEKHLGAARLRRRYAAAFEALGSAVS
jgi:hypothetical protein